MPTPTLLLLLFGSSSFINFCCKLFSWSWKRTISKFLTYFCTNLKGTSMFSFLFAHHKLLFKFNFIFVIETKGYHNYSSYDSGDAKFHKLKQILKRKPLCPCPSQRWSVYFNVYEINRTKSSFLYVAIWLT